jgi:hypothetical protein
MTSNHSLEIARAGGEKLLSLVLKEFTSSFFIVARTPDYIVVGDGEKNVSFSRAKNRVIERVILNKESAIERKR